MKELRYVKECKRQKRHGAHYATWGMRHRILESYVSLECFRHFHLSIATIVTCSITLDIVPFRKYQLHVPIILWIYRSILIIIIHGSIMPDIILWSLTIVFPPLIDFRGGGCVRNDCLFKSMKSRLASSVRGTTL